ncbi:MAG TPA: cupin domain-containing protein [Terriglobia bacterium]|nr:cupin domain-containing protein [Terriglobia bacterium]
MGLSRRDLCLMLPALLTALPADSSASIFLPSKVYRFQDLPVRDHAGSRSRPVLNGETHTGFPIELHETELAPGARPHPPHHHVHEEIFLIREGAVEVTIGGKSSRLGPGSVAYVASNAQHGIQNTGKIPAQYFVLALDTDHS